MKRLSYLVMLLPLFVACQPTVPQAEYDRMKSMHDSVAAVADDMASVINLLNLSVDQMAKEEGLIFVDDNGNDIKDKSQVLSHMKAFRDHMAQQRQQIDDLKKQIATNDRSYNAKLQKMMDNMKAQLIEKDTRIAELQKALEEKNASLADLRTQLDVMTAARQQAEESRDFFIDVARAQEEALNTAYYIVGKKSELKDAGVIEGTFKKKANYANFDTEKFTKVDAREFTELVIESKSPTLITEKPEDTYTLVKNGDGTTTLTITDAAKFWAGSPFLVIEL
ncbi:MAG: hypothetical protein KBT20_02780 [Bacteroidales bacterium]|nr:hypothetical protein [Candidatus Liminaster caballi]